MIALPFGFLFQTATQTFYSFFHVCDPIAERADILFVKTLSVILDTDRKLFACLHVNVNLAACECFTILCNASFTVR